MVPLLYLQGMSLWEKPHMQFFPLAVAGYVWFLSELKPALPDRSRFKCAKYGAWTGLSVFILGAFLYSPWMVELSAILVTVSFSLSRFGQTSWTRLLALSGLLWIILPLPGNLDTRFIQFLQQTSSFATSGFLDFLRMPHLREANIIQIPERRLFVEEACSGVDSLYALTAVAITIALTKRRSLIHSIIPVATAPLWAALANFVRLLVIAVGLHWLGVDLSKGTPHTILGLVVFGGSVLCHILTDLFVADLFHPIGMSSEGIQNRVTKLLDFAWEWPWEVEESDGDSQALPKREMGSFVFLVPTVVMGLLSAWVLLTGKNNYQDQFRFPDAFHKTMPKEEALAGKLKGWRVHAFEEQKRERNDPFGENSRTWAVANDHLRGMVSVDFPFRGWHGLYVCYLLTGWTIEDLHAEMGDGPESWPYVEGRIRQPDGRVGYLWYCYVDIHGKAVSPTDPKEVGEQVARDLALRFRRDNVVSMALGQLVPSDPITYQIQLFHESPVALGKADSEQLRVVFLEAREHLRQRLPYHPNQP